MQFWALIVDSFRESLDRKIFWVIGLITLLVAGAMFCIGFEPGKLTILFGMWEIETQRFTLGGVIRADMIATITVDLIMDTVVGWIGITLAIIATAGFFPAFLERGAVDVVLSKPMSRYKLFLFKYAGTMVFVLFHATAFVVLTFLVIGFRWGVWLPGYLLAIPLLVLLFSYLYCISVWVAVAFRSTVAAVLLTLGAWVFFFGVQSLEDTFDMFPTWKEHRTVYNAVRTARWIVPKTQDITYLARKWAGAGASADIMPSPGKADRQLIERASKIEENRMGVNPLYTIGSSLLFEAVIVLLAMWKFSRTDY